MSTSVLELDGLVHRPRRRPPLWSSDAVARVVITDLLALVGLAVAARMAADQDAVSDQLVWINVGAGSLVLSGIANGRWLLSGRSEVGLRRVQLVDVGGTDQPAPAPDDDEDGAGVLVATTTGTLFHRPGCGLLAARPVVGGPAEEHRRVGRAPCPVCEP